MKWLKHISFFIMIFCLSYIFLTRFGKWDSIFNSFALINKISFKMSTDVLTLCLCHVDQVVELCWWYEILFQTVYVSYIVLTCRLLCVLVGYFLISTMLHYYVTLLCYTTQLLIVCFYEADRQRSVVRTCMA